MKITSFRIQHFKNIQLAECDEIPDFVVICGGNGCGKSALFEALMLAKENAAPYGGRVRIDPRCVSANAPTSHIHMRVQFSEVEREWYQQSFQQDCPEFDEVQIQVDKGASQGRVQKRSEPIRQLFSSYSRDVKNSPGFFDHVDAHRFHKKKDLKSWDASSLNDATIKQSLVADGRDKFGYTKEYLASLVMGDLQEIQRARREGRDANPDSLAEIRNFFDRFFAPMEFVDVCLDRSPFEYVVRTHNGEIDIDDLSSGEKEIINTFIRFHQLNPRDAVLLIDEADAHLHPDLERRYLSALRDIGQGNQVWITTHSPEMMIEAGAASLFTMLKCPTEQNPNQFVRVSSSDELHASLSELMGSRGLVSFNQRIVFIEGSDSSADRIIYEHFYPASEYNISFVPTGDSGTVSRTADRIDSLLTTSIGFQNYFSIVDGDIERSDKNATSERLFKLPVYHVENFLLRDDAIFSVVETMLSNQCPYKDPAGIEEILKHLLFEEGHLKPFTRALLDAKLAGLAKRAYDSVFKSSGETFERPTFKGVEEEAREILTKAQADNTWRHKCKGRDLLKVFCKKHGFNYEHFRNLVLDRITRPPEELQSIMDRIFAS